MRLYTADFETTTLETCEDECWVWVYGFRELYKGIESFRWGQDLEEFMEYAKNGENGENKTFYFHNLRFDGMFILDYLERSGYTWTDSKKAIPNTYRTLITKEGQFYQIEVIYGRKGRNLKKTVFRDSLKKLPFRVERIATSFKLPILKGSIDYKKVRPKGYEPTDEELDYLENDVEIMAQALEIQLEEGQTGMTIGSDSLRTFKEIIGQKKFERLFPVLSKGVDDFIRESYKGGFTYVNPWFANQLIGKGKVFDVNSLYPAMMLMPLPCGEPIYYKGKYQPSRNYPLYIQKIFCEFELKEGYIPTIQIKNDSRFSSTEYLASSKDKDGNEQPVFLHLTNVDLELFFKHYNVTMCEYIEGYMFRQVENIFRDYITRFMKIKETTKGAKRELAKLLLNNLYGKFCSSTDATNRYVELDKETDTIKLKVPTKDKVKDSIYTALGSFVTSYGRKTTIEAAQTNFDRFIYADTDSLHVLGLEPLKNIWEHPTKLGAWKHEGDFTKAKFIRAKTYIEALCMKELGTDEEGKVLYETCSYGEMNTSKIKVTCAGMPPKVKSQVTFDNFHVGSTFTGKSIPKVIKGGVVLVDTDFTIKI